MEVAPGLHCVNCLTAYTAYTYYKKYSSFYISKIFHMMGFGSLHHLHYLHCLGKGLATKLDDFLEKFQTAFDSPPSFLENHIAIFIMGMVVFMQGGMGAR